MDRHQGELISTLTDLLSKHRAGGEKEPRKDYLMCNWEYPTATEFPATPGTYDCTGFLHPGQGCCFLTHLSV